jgi:hypothetical protein
MSTIFKDKPVKHPITAGLTLDRLVIVSTLRIFEVEAIQERILYPANVCQLLRNGSGKAETQQ